MWNAYGQGGGEGGYSQKNWAGVSGPLPKTPTLSVTKICDIPYCIYDLTINTTRNFSLTPWIFVYTFETLFMTWRLNQNIDGTLIQTAEMTKMKWNSKKD